MSTTPPSVSQSRQPSATTIEKREVRSQIRSLKRTHTDKTLSRFPRNPIGIDVLANDLALRSSQLVLDAMKTREAVTRADNRKGRDVKKLRLSHAA